MLSDTRFALRLLVKSPGFSVVAVLVLALGIGANTAMFTVVNAMIFQPIPTDDPQIVGIYTRDRTRPRGYRGFSVQTWQQVRESRELFADVMAHTLTMVGTTEGETTRRFS